MLRKSIDELLQDVLDNRISIDDVLNYDYKLTDFQCYFEEIKREISNCPYWSVNTKWHRDDKDKKSLCKLLIEAYKNKELLDNTEKIESIELSMDWNDLDTISKEVDNSYDALVISLNDKAKVDIPYIAKLSNKSKEEVIKELKGVIYQNPCTFNNEIDKGWETADEYLSGSMSKKLLEALEAEKMYPGYFKDNIKAINKVYPKVVCPSDIYVTLGTPWIPTDIIDSFIEHILGETHDPNRKLAITKHDTLTGTWETPNKGRYYFGEYGAIKYSWGTKRCNPLRLIENALNMKKPMVYDTEYGIKQDGRYGEVRVLNKKETALAVQKQNEIIEEFQKWIWNDDERKERLLKIYEDNYASFVKRKYDGSFLKLSGINQNIKLYDYQKNAIARILFSKNTLLAHDVGSGKTYEMIAAGQELKRIGLSNKNMYVVPNNIVSQWKNSFEKLYPGSKVLTVEPKSFTKNKRQSVLKDIVNNDYDGIIIAYSCLDSIPVSKNFELAKLKKEKVNILESMSKVTSNTTLLNKRLEKLNKEIIDLKISGSDEQIYFDDLNITRLFIDEAHNYKNVPITTKMSYVLGINSKGSKKCKDMFDKVSIVQEKNNGGGVVMATGTPITNSLTEAYIFQLYLQRGDLNILELESFDSWAGMFGETVTDFEIDVTTNSYKLTSRFSKFHNLPELTNLMSCIADFHKLDKTNNIPEFNGYTDLKIHKTLDFEHVLNEISARADTIRNHKVKRKDDNMLKLTTDGRKAALDLRLYNKDYYTYSPNSKVEICASKIYEEYIKGKENKTTQLVFCDSSTPKKDFNMYDELTRILVLKGIDRKEISYIHDATSEKQREELYKEVNNGDIRILIGSTFKLGIGVNIQERVAALHHLDIPWRPADMCQREGRILRQGNTNKYINIYRYVTEGSFDAYSWQLLETKQKFITELLNGSLDIRDGEEIDNTVLSYGEIKAIAIGNPLIKERVEILNEISRLKMIQSANNALKIEAQRELIELPSIIEIQKDVLRKAQEDYEYIKTLDLDKEKKLSKAEQDYQQECRKSLREKIDNGLKGNILLPYERDLMEYNNFKVKLPKDMSKDKPYLNIQRVGRYSIEMSDSEKGNLIRLDNFFISFNKLIIEYQQKIEILRKRKIDLENELLKKDTTFDMIKNLSEKLNSINERLDLKYEN